jgi:membrane-associated phospholipid phosphatase
MGAAEGVRARCVRHWGFAFAALALLSPSRASADEGSASTGTGAAGRVLHWDPAWTHAGAWDYALSGIGATTLVTETVLFQNAQQPVRFYGPLLFDDAARDFFRGGNVETQQTAANVSWAFWGLDVVGPFAIDLPYALIRFDAGVAWDLAWQDATTLLLASSVDVALRNVIGRARPKDSDCLEAGGGAACLNPESSRSFPSGHFTEVSAGAALICTQHLSLELYGGPWDMATCVGAIVSAGTVGVLRLVADNHWTTDVLGSGLLGTAFGWGVPYFMHLRWHPVRSAKGVALAPLPMFVADGVGASVVGVF